MAEKMRIFSTVEDVYKALDDGVAINEKFSYTHPTKTGGKSIRLSLGRIWFNLLQPSDFPLINEPTTKKMISNLIKKASEELTPEEASDYLTRVNQETFKMSSYIPTTFQIDSLILPEEVKDDKNQLKKEDISDPMEFSKRVSGISKKITDNMANNDYRIDNIRISGAKGIPWEQLNVAQGFVSDIESQLHGPIKTAIADGNSPKDFYTSASEARRGFYY